MKRFLLWVLGVAVGVAVLLGVVMGISWAGVNRTDLPDAAGAAFGGQPLEENGSCWQVPLVGAVVDKVLYSAPTLTVQKLDPVAEAHPAVTLPDWANYATLEITARDSGQVCFSGTLEEYAAFYYPAAGSYEIVLRAWHLPGGMAPGELAAPTDRLVRSPGLERPARPVGWYGYRFRFTLAATPEVTLSAGTVQQGGTVCLVVRGMLGSETPAAETDLGTVAFQPEEGGWRGYLGVAYNADAGSHIITVTAGGQQAETALVVSGRQYGRAEVTPTQDSEEANAEFRNKIWPLYTAAAGPQQWMGAWVCPVIYDSVLVDYGVVKMVNGKAGSKSNSTTFAAVPDTEVVAPASGTVVFAGELQLTGRTVVIDHGCGVRTYLYGLADYYVQKGDAVIRNGPVGLAGETLTLDVKIGNKSVCPWDLFRGQGGLFYLG